MAILGKGPRPKKKNKNVIPPSKVGMDPKSGQTVAAPGYKMGVIPKRGEAPTKEISVGFGSPLTVQSGIYGPIPVGPGKKVAAAPVKKVDKRYGKGLTATGKVLRKVKEAVNPGNYSFKLGRGGGGGGKTCAAYSGYPNRRK